MMSKYNCSNCQRLLRPEKFYIQGINNVCAPCYAVMVQHPSARKLVK